jgi:hypothetical protein
VARIVLATLARPARGVIRDPQSLIDEEAGQR